MVRRHSRESLIHRIICERLIARTLRYCSILFVENETEWNEMELVTFFYACCIYIRMYIWHVKCPLHSTVYIRLLPPKRWNILMGTCRKMEHLDSMEAIHKHITHTQCTDSPHRKMEHLDGKLPKDGTS